MIFSRQNYDLSVSYFVNVNLHFLGTFEACMLFLVVVYEISYMCSLHYNSYELLNRSSIQQYYLHYEYLVQDRFCSVLSLFRVHFLL